MRGSALVTINANTSLSSSQVEYFRFTCGPTWRSNDDCPRWQIPIEQINQMCGLVRVAGYLDFSTIYKLFWSCLVHIEPGPTLAGHRQDNIRFTLVFLGFCNIFHHGAADVQPGLRTITKSNRTNCLSCHSFSGQYARESSLRTWSALQR